MRIMGNSSNLIKLLPCHFGIWQSVQGEQMSLWKTRPTFDIFCQIYSTLLTLAIYFFHFQSYSPYGTNHPIYTKDRFLTTKTNAKIICQCFFLTKGFPVSLGFELGTFWFLLCIFSTLIILQLSPMYYKHMGYYLSICTYTKALSKSWIFKFWGQFLTTRVCS
jgi:hypothetical protein